jgi:uncharacterized protein (TIGR03437 family)
VHIRLAACLSVAIARLLAQTWAVQDVKQLGVWGNYSFTVATATGDIYLGSGLPPLSPPTLVYGDVSKSGVYVSKVNAEGAAGFSAEIGGVHVINAMAADSAGNVYIAGTATPTGLPVTAGAYRTAPNGDFGGFVCELKPDGTQAFCTYLEPAQIDVTGLAVDSAGNVYIGGANLGSAAPTPGSLALGGRAFVSKLAAGGGQLLFVAQLGSDASVPGPIAADGAGNIYVAGAAAATSFLAEVSADGASLLNYSDGKTGEKLAALSVDGSANVYLAGSETNGVMFVRKYAHGDLAISYEKQFGASNPGVVPNGPVSVPTAMAVDAFGNANLVGFTNTVNFPQQHNTEACDLASFPGGENGFLVSLSPEGDLLQSTFLAPGGIVSPAAIAVTPAGGYVAGGLMFGSGPADTQIVALALAPLTGGSEDLQLDCAGNGATFQFAGMAPGEMVSLFGNGIGPDTGVSYELDANGRLATMLNETQVTFDGIAAPLLYVQSSQINAIAPWEIAGKTTSEICVTYRRAMTNCIETAVVGAAPGVFVAGTGYAAVVNEDQTINSPDNPAPAGSVVSIYATGMGPVTPVPADGSVTQLPLPEQNYSVRYMIPQAIPPDVAAEVLYAGPAPFEPAGLTQINVRVQASFGYLQVMLPDGTARYSPIFAFAAKGGQ